MITISCFLATATIFSKWDRGNTEPQGFDGLFTTIARVFLSIKDSNCETSACQPRSGESTCVFSKLFFFSILVSVEVDTNVRNASQIHLELPRSFRTVEIQDEVRECSYPRRPTRKWQDQVHPNIHSQWQHLKTCTLSQKYSIVSLLLIVQQELPQNVCNRSLDVWLRWTVTCS